MLATFQVNLRCNSACGYCDLPLNAGRYEMTREAIRGVFSCLYRDGVRFVLVQGGEPLLRRDMPEILEDLLAIGFHLTLITNGTNVTPQLVERLGRLPLAISVSLDMLDRVKYQQTRRRVDVFGLAWYIGQRVVRCRAWSCRPGAATGVVDARGPNIHI